MTRDDVLAAVRDRAAALASCDPQRLTACLHEGFVWTSHRGDVFDRSAYVESNTRRLRWRSQEILDPQVVIVADTAVVTGRVRDVVERDGETPTFIMRITQTWVRTPDGWRCLAGHAGPLAPADQA